MRSKNNILYGDEIILLIEIFTSIALDLYGEGHGKFCSQHIFIV